MASQKKPDTNVDGGVRSTVIPSEVNLTPVYGEFTVSINGTVIAQDKNPINMHRIYSIKLDCLAYRYTHDRGTWLRQLQDSIDEHGQMMEILVNRQNLVLDGNKRVQVMLELGETIIAGRIIDTDYEMMDDFMQVYNLESTGGDPRLGRVLHT